MCLKSAALAVAVGVTLVQAGQECGVEKSFNLVHHNPWLVLLILKTRLGEYDLEAKRECVRGVCTDRVLDVEVEPCLPTGQLADAAVFSAAGWGVDPRRGEYSHVKKIIPLPYVKKYICQAAYKNTNIPEISICAGGEAGIDTCSGDSGGPLIWMKEKAELWGVTSSGNVHCGTKGTPGIYMSVIDHLDWINSVLKEAK
ncbi:Hemolymph proteinase 10 [Operophtera brumata]|uniref:Hemolymph proteinase 10 n=1 Tax=Operophtera brumata TaxID=104452 RepID=A0A0L7LPA6_OPEBR|nr:Hemolymph proteinase 10 [Operophtera brumata]